MKDTQKYNFNTLNGYESQAQLDWAMKQQTIMESIPDAENEVQQNMLGMQHRIVQRWIEPKENITQPGIMRGSPAVMPGIEGIGNQLATPILHIGRGGGARITGGTGSISINWRISPKTLTPSLYNKFQMDFNIDGLPFTITDPEFPGPDPFDPDVIDIFVQFQCISSPTVEPIYVHAYYGVEYLHRDIDPARDPTKYDSNGYRTLNGYQYHHNAGPDQCNPQPPLSVGEDANYLTDPDPFLWHARFAPTAVGEWMATIYLSVLGRAYNVLPVPSFNVSESSNPGYIGTINPGGEVNRNFCYQNQKGRPIFLPVGSNAEALGGNYNWNRLPYLYVNWVMQQLAVNGGNLLRFWCAPDRFGLERYYQDPITRYQYLPGDYSWGLKRAFSLDQIVDDAEALVAGNPVYLQLVLEESLFFVPNWQDDEGNIGKEWKENPYHYLLKNNTAYNHIPDDKLPKLFFSDTECKNYYKRKLRYVMARWGYSTNIFAFEFFSEVYKDTIFSDGEWKSTPGGWTIVRDWVNEMIDFCKNQCWMAGNHMFTISVTGAFSSLPNLPEDGSPQKLWPANAGDFINTMNIDFYTDHFYCPPEFFNYRINYLANRARLLYPGKPFIIGECSLNTNTDDIDKANNPIPYCLHWVNNTEDPTKSKWNSVDGLYPGSFVKGTSLYDVYYFHDVLFASVLSGCAGTVTVWDSINATNEDWGGQFAYYNSLVLFLQGEDLDMSNCIAIRSMCPEHTIHKYPVDNAITDSNSAIYGLEFGIQSGHVTFTSKSVWGDIPQPWFNFDAIPREFFNSNIDTINNGTLNDGTIEVFALQNTKSNKIIGWVKNRYNIWNNMPHNQELDWIQGNPFNYPCVNFDPTNPESVHFLLNASIIINKISNGQYKIDFYNVYPEWGNALGTNSDCDIIPGFSTTVNVFCNSLTIPIPYLEPLMSGNNPIAPDYGFKITPIYIGWGWGYFDHAPQNNWYNGALTYSPTAYYIHDHNYPNLPLQPFAVGNNGTMVVFVGEDSRMMLYYRKNVDTYSWTLISLEQINSQFYVGPTPAAGGSLAFTEEAAQIYYTGIDNTLHCAYLDAVTGWNHAHLSTIQMQGEIGTASHGGKIFFRGRVGHSDYHLYFCFWELPNNWNTYNFTEYIHAGTAQRPAPDTNFAVNEDGSFVAYKSNNGNLAFIFKTPTTSTDPRDQYGYYWWDDDHKVQGSIRISNSGNTVLYLNQSNQLTAVFWDGAEWATEIINTIAGPISFTGFFDITRDRELDTMQIYYCNSDGDIQVAYKQDGVWIYGPIICPEWYMKCAKKSFIRVNSGMVLYWGLWKIFHFNPHDENSNYVDSFRAYYYGKGDVESVE